VAPAGGVVVAGCVVFVGGGVLVGVAGTGAFGALMGGADPLTTEPGPR
jgi:hypothetical protein